jgi:hypothetical protein
MEHTEEEVPLLHDPPCGVCGHAAHTYLACGDGCACEPTPMPGAEKVVAQT